MLRVPETEEHGGVAQRVLPDRERRDPDATADEQRPPIGLRRAEADAERTEQPQPVARAQLAQAPRARAHVLEEEVEPAVLVGAENGERAREEGPLVGPSAPPLARRQHVELPRVRRRPAGVEHGDHVVGATPSVSDHGAEAAAERGERAVHPRRGRGGAGPVAHALSAACDPRAWRSWSETTSGSPRRAAAIARAAAMPPDSVVMHGMPRAIAAPRIS